ncbi:MAG: hypothetical protein J1E62_04105 [Lachnospiraceae bacterium]|nr:hypothetical protein [Lachnospiraceae bacterium]
MKNSFKKQVYLLIGLFLISSTSVGCGQKDTTVERDNVFEESQKDSNNIEGRGVDDKKQRFIEG